MTFVNISPKHLDISPYLKTANAPTLEYLQVESQESDNHLPALLFLHGILGDARTWQPYLTAFPDYDTLAVTQSGFSQKPAQESDLDDAEVLFNTQRHAKELIAFCRTLNQQADLPHRQFKIVAWSYACHVSLLAAQMAPELFESMILYELIVPTYGMTEENQARFTKDITKMMSPIIKAYRRQKPDLAVDLFVSACKNTQYSLSDQSEQLQVIKQDNAESLQKLLTQVEPKPISAVALMDIHQQTPITILYGENSRDIFKLSSEAGMMAISQKEGCIQKADHLLPEEDPQRMIAILQSLLA